LRDPRVYLAHILESIARIETYVAQGKDSFFKEPLIQDAVIRNFEVIGEAAKRIPDSFRQANPGIPWRSLASFRDVLIHQYEGVSLLRVWQVIENELPKLKESIASLLPPLDQLEREINGEK
jgi:uncharacterized protein with HEPN domain